MTKGTLIHPPNKSNLTSRYNPEPKVVRVQNTATAMRTNTGDPLQERRGPLFNQKVWVKCWLQEAGSWFPTGKKQKRTTGHLRNRRTTPTRSTGLRFWQPALGSLQSRLGVRGKKGAARKGSAEKERNCCPKQTEAKRNGKQPHAMTSANIYLFSTPPTFFRATLKGDVSNHQKGKSPPTHNGSTVATVRSTLRSSPRRLSLASASRPGKRKMAGKREWLTEDPGSKWCPFGIFLDSFEDNLKKAPRKNKEEENSALGGFASFGFNTTPK